jgi:hypothetical protein
VLVLLVFAFMVQDGRHYLGNDHARLAAVVATCRQLFDIEDESREGRSRQYNQVRPATLVAEPLHCDSFGRSWPSIIVLLFRLLFSSCFLVEPIGCSRASVQCASERFGRRYE